MKVRILVDGAYSDFESEPRYRAVLRAAGEEVEYVEWYARSLVASGMAEESHPLPPPLIREGDSEPAVETAAPGPEPAVETAAPGPEAAMSPSGDKRERQGRGGPGLSATGVELGKAREYRGRGG